MALEAGDVSGGVNTVSIERRQCIRQDVVLPCAWQGESETREAKIADLGLGGCFIESNVLPAIGEEIELSVVLDGPESLMGPAVHVLRGFGFAMRFAHVDPGSLGRLEAWLARERFSAG